MMILKKILYIWFTVGGTIFTLGLVSSIIHHFSREEVSKGNGIPWNNYNEEYILPDLDKWGQIEVGMSEETVVELLGDPINRVDPDGDYEPNHTYPRYYGYTSRRSVNFSHDLDLVVQVEMGKVHRVDDWFGEVELSKDGSPTIPKLLTPINEVVYDHYPRVVDMRWFASSGDYPIRYEVDVDTLYGSGKWSEGSYLNRVQHPYASHVHAGSNKGRWRVRAINEKGTSEWSNYRYFTFTSGGRVSPGSDE